MEGHGKGGERGADKREGLNKQGGSVWIGRGGGSSAVATSLGDVSERGVRDYR